jgi:hypothetical protein
MDPLKGSEPLFLSAKENGAVLYEMIEGPLV